MNFGSAPVDRGSPGTGPASEATAGDLRWMREALSLARQGESAPGASPIGCVIVLDGRIVGDGHNEVGLRHDPTAHAEIVAIRRACAALGRDDLRGAVLYTTLQACGMCTMASIWARIGRIVHGAERDQVHRMYFEDRHLDTMNFIRDAYRDDLEVVGRVLGDECAALYHRPDDDVPRDEQGNV